MRPQRLHKRQLHLAGRILFTTAFPQGVEIGPDGFPVLDTHNQPLLPYDIPEDLDFPDSVDEGFVLDTPLAEDLDPEEDAERRVWFDHIRTRDANRVAYGALLHDEAYEPPKDPASEDTEEYESDSENVSMDEGEESDDEGDEEEESINTMDVDALSEPLEELLEGPLLWTDLFTNACFDDPIEALVTHDDQ